MVPSFNRGKVEADVPIFLGPILLLYPELVSVGKLRQFNLIFLRN
jgi:hypothetical protein